MVLRAARRAEALLMDGARRGAPDGIVLAGGAGRRMGRSKASIVLGTDTLVARAVALLVERCADVVVVSRPDVPMPSLAVPVRFDRPGPDAPLTGLATGLAALSAPDVLVLACDLPFAGPALDRIATGDPGRGRVACEDGRPQPLCARYPRVETGRIAGVLLAEGRLALSALVDELDPIHVEAPAGSLRNLNTRTDLEVARVLNTGT